MVAAAQRQSMLIRKGGEIVWMHSLHYEPDKRSALIWSEQADSRQFLEPFRSINGELRIALENGCQSDRFEVVNGRGQADRPCDIWRSSLKSVRRFLEAAFVPSDAYDHFTAPVPGRHGVENFSATIKGANTCRGTHFVSGESEEVATHLLNIYGQMSRALRRIDERQSAHGARLPAEVDHGID